MEEAAEEEEGVDPTLLGDLHHAVSTPRHHTSIHFRQPPDHPLTTP